MGGSINDRITRIKRENWWLKLTVSICLMLILLIILMGQTGQNKISETIKAKSFYVVDEEGKIRVQISALGKGAGVLINNKEGMPLAILSASPNGSSLSLNDKEGKSRLMLVVSGYTGSGEVYLYDQYQFPRVKMFLTQDGSPSLTFSDKEQKILWNAP